MALAKKIKKESGRVFCLVGDGELNEGSCWEAFLLASQHKLNNLVVIVDYNGSTDRAVNLSCLKDKLKAFGFLAQEIHGHDCGEIKDSCHIEYSHTKPTALITFTTKGNGCERMQYPDWHHRAPDEDELAEILDELE